MLIKGNFQENKEIEVLEYEVELKDIKRNVGIILNDATYEHIPIVVKDPANNLRGVFTFKTNQRAYYIGKTENLCSNFTKAGELLDGKWKVIVFKPYKFGGHFSLEIEKDVRIFNGGDVPTEKFKISKEKRWYKGDCHCHSIFSDGDLSTQEILYGIDSNESDYHFMTDHNLVWQKFPKNYNIFSGTELTLDDEGHMNFLGLDEMIDFSKFITEKKSKVKIMEEIISYVKSKNALVMINHPFLIIGFHHNIKLEDVDLIEVINSPHDSNKKRDNLKSVEALDYLWSRGYKIFGAGGSDTHRNLVGSCNSTIGSPSNFTFADSNLLEDIKSGLKSGKNYVVTRGNVDLQIKDKNNTEYLLGTEIDSEIIFKISSSENIIWEVMKNGVKIAEKKDKNFEYKIKLEAKEFLRIQGLDEEGNLTVFINPIYNGTIEKIETNWFDVLNYLKNKN